MSTAASWRVSAGLYIDDNLSQDKGWSSLPLADRPVWAKARPNVCLGLSNAPENVVLVREMLVGVGEAIGLDGSALSDIRTAVTEACNNVVLHAYAGGPGPLEIEVFLDAQDDVCAVVVRDRGIGLEGHRPLLDGRSDGSGTAAHSAARDVVSGIGLPVIHALVRRIELGDTPGGGTEVRMQFATPGVRAVAAEPAGAQSVAASDDSGGASAPDGSGGASAAGTPDGGHTAAIAIAPVELARTVLPRMLSVLAAQADLSTDRIADAQLLADALVACAHRTRSHGSMDLTVDVTPRNLKLRVGPLGADEAEELLAAASDTVLSAVIPRLADHRLLAGAGSHQVLTLALSDRQ